MAYLIKITVKCTDNIYRVDFKCDDNHSFVNWKISDGGNTYSYVDYNVAGGPVVNIEMKVNANNYSSYDYVIERKDGNDWIQADKGHFTIQAGRTHGFKKTINLSKDKDTNNLPPVKVIT